MSYFNLFPTMVIWWYKDGVVDLFSFLKALYVYIENFFSILTVLKTFFAPWKRLVSQRKPGIAGLQDWFIDNLVSRGVGLLLRFSIIISFIIFIFLYSLFCVLSFIFWVGFPAILVTSFVFIFVR